MKYTYRSPKAECKSHRSKKFSSYTRTMKKKDLEFSVRFLFALSLMFLWVLQLIKYRHTSF